MPTLGKFSAWIEVDGEHLPEFVTELSDDHSTVTCWVPSEAGKEFSIGWKDSNLEYTLRGTAYVDGHRCGGKLCRYPKLRGAMVSTVNDVTTGPSTCRALVFSEIDLTDDDQYLQSSSHVESLGEIKVILHESVCVRKGKVKARSKVSDKTTSVPDKMTLHERSKKGMGHHVGLGKEKQLDSSKSKSKSQSVYNNIRTVATFIFRYRPLGILQANGIAPVDQSNKRKSSTPPEEPSDDEEEKAAAAEIELLKARLHDLEGRKKKGIKIEVKTEPLSGFRPPKHLGVIDLTDLD